MPVYQNSCKKCAHYILARSCVAFPDGIPDDIWTGQNTHTHSRLGDNNVTYKPLKEGEEEKEEFHIS